MEKGYLFCIIRITIRFTRDKFLCSSFRASFVFLFGFWIGIHRSFATDIKKINLVIGWFGLGVMAIFYGTISGVILGPGSVLLTALAANGLMGPQIIGTDSFITIINVTARLISFRSLGLLNNEAILFGSMIGSVAILGSYTARKIADKLGVKLHTIIIEVCVVLGGTVMIYRALTF